MSLALDPPTKNVNAHGSRDDRVSDLDEPVVAALDDRLLLASFLRLVRPIGELVHRLSKLALQG